MISKQGWINLYNPKNITSFKAINSVKKKFSIDKIGHAGTLDPMAEGVLPIAIGKATKLIPYISNMNKEYEFTVTWGTQTTTDDAEGKILFESNYFPERNEIEKKISNLNSKEFVLKAQIHAGGRGKAGGVKLIKNISELQYEAKKMMGKILVTHQTGSEGKEVKRLYIEEASDILKEFYLSCLVDRESSKIAFISSTEGGMDIEKVALENPNKIITTKINLKDDGPSDNEIESVISIFKLETKQKETE